MGAGIAEVAAKAGYEVVLRSRHAGERRRHGRRTREVARPSRSSGASSTTPSARPSLARVTATADAGRPGRLRPRDRVGRRGPRRQEGSCSPSSTRCARPTRSSPPTPRRCRSIEMAVRDRAARAGLRHPLLQPGADDERWSRSSARSPPATRRSPRPRPSPSACGKDAVEVKDRAGFIVNALLFPYLNNAVRMLEHGTASLRRHRHRHEGRLQLPDGSVRAARPRRASTRRWRSSTRSTTSSATRTTRRAAAAAHGRAPGRLGRKSGAGFYDYRR